MKNINCIFLIIIFIFVFVLIKSIYYKEKFTENSNNLVRVATVHNSPPVITNIMKDLTITKNQIDSDSANDIA